MDSRALLKSAGVVSAMTLCSRALGMVRDMLTASLLGTSLAMSAFVVAFTIPNLFRRLFGEGALASGLVPVFMEVREKHGLDAAWRLARRVITLTAIVLAVLVGAGVLGSVLVLRYGHPGERTAVILQLMCVMLPYAVFICIGALFMALLNSFRHFLVPAAMPSLMNIVWMLALAATLWMGDATLMAKVRMLAWAVLAAGVLQMGLQIPMLWRFGYRPGLSCHWRDPDVAQVLRLTGPAALGLAVTQFNVIIDRGISTWIGAWAPAAMFYSERLLYFPLGICATALGTVLLPAFSGHTATADHAQMKTVINHSLRLLLFLMFPAAIGLLVLAYPITELIFQWKMFDARSTELTARALAFYAPGLVVFSLSKVLAPAFYALKDSRTPLRGGVLTVTLNIVLNLLFVVTWPLYWKHAGLALATVLAESFFAGFLAMRLHHVLGSPGWPEIVRSAARSGAAGLACGAAAWLTSRAAPPALAALTSSAKLIQLGSVAAAMAAGGIAFLIAAGLLRSPELRQLTQALRRRGRAKKTAAHA